MSNLETDQLSDLEPENAAVASETSEGDLLDNEDAQNKLKLLRLRNVGRVIIGYLNTRLAARPRSAALACRRTELLFGRKLLFIGICSC